MKRFILLLAASALLAAVLCGCETGAGTSHTNPPKVTANVTSSPAPATPSMTPAPDVTSTPDVTERPDVTETPDATPAIPDATDTPAPENPGDAGTNTGSGEVPQPRHGGLM